MTSPLGRRIGRIVDEDPAAAAEALPGLLEWIPQISPRYQSPRHLAQLVSALERAIERAQGADKLSLQAISTVPPRHAKTETILHSVAYGLAKRPDLTFGYATYNEHLAASKSRKAMALAQRAGVQLVSENVAEWRTAEGGGMLAAGIMGTWTGHGVDIAIVDDPFKNRLEAESATYRNRVWDQFNDAICTRIEPGGSLIVNMTRWHPDDLVGRLLGEEPDKWELMRAPAINDLGAALWPERWPLHLLQARRERVGEYTWASLYQGQPRPRGGALFGEPHTYSQLPTGFSFIAEAMGLDFAYSKKTASDWSALAHFGIVDGKVYVLDVIRRQLKSPEFKALVHATWETRGKPDLRWYGYGPELGIADFMRQDPYSVPLQIKQAPGDHFIRAQPFAAAWNAGEVLVPEDAPWLDDYLAELCSFTGVNDDHDDQVDASGAAFDQLSHLRDHFLPKQFAHGSPEWAAMEQAEMELAALAQMEQDREDKSQWEDWAR